MNIHDQDNFLRGKKEGIQEGLQKGVQQGIQQKAMETAKALLTVGDSVEKVLAITGLSIETIVELKKNSN